jgi:hypothetical protein
MKTTFDAIRTDLITPIENEVVLPEQFFTTQTPVFSGEKRLLFALFENALDLLRITCHVHTHRASCLWNETITWVYSTEQHYGSFEFCCSHLGFDPKGVRGALRQRYNNLEKRVPLRASLHKAP